MAASAAQLVDSVIPEVPVRQWVLSLPFDIRFRLAYDPKLLARVRKIFLRALMSWIQRRVNQESDVEGNEDRRCYVRAKVRLGFATEPSGAMPVIIISLIIKG